MRPRENPMGRSWAEFPRSVLLPVHGQKADRCERAKLGSVAENQDIVFKVRDPDGIVRLIPAKLVEKAVLAGGVLVSAEPEADRGATHIERSNFAEHFKEDTDDWTGIGITGGVRRPKP